MARNATRPDRYVAAFMEDRIGSTFDARITGVTRFGLFVRLRDTGAEGLSHAALGTEFFRHDEARHALVGQRSKTLYKLGDIVPVRLVEAAPLTGDCVSIWPRRPNAAKQRSATINLAYRSESGGAERPPPPFAPRMVPSLHSLTASGEENTGAFLPHSRSEWRRGPRALRAWWRGLPHAICQPCNPSTLTP